MPDASPNRECGREISIINHHHHHFIHYLMHINEIWFRQLFRIFIYFKQGEKKHSIGSCHAIIRPMIIGLVIIYINIIYFPLLRRLHFHSGPNLIFQCLILLILVNLARSLFFIFFRTILTNFGHTEPRDGFIWFQGRMQCE